MNTYESSSYDICPAYPNVIPSFILFRVPWRLAQSIEWNVVEWTVLVQQPSCCSSPSYRSILLQSEDIKNDKGSESSAAISKISTLHHWWPTVRKKEKRLLVWCELMQEGKGEVEWDCGCHWGCFFWLGCMQRRSYLYIQPKDFQKGTPEWVSCPCAGAGSRQISCSRIFHETRYQPKTKLSTLPKTLTDLQNAPYIRQYIHPMPFTVLDAQTNELRTTPFNKCCSTVINNFLGTHITNTFHLFQLKYEHGNSYRSYQRWYNELWRQ